MRSSEEYYDDQKSWGEYQYVTMKDVVNNFMINLTQDHLLHNIPRRVVLLQAKRGIRELYYDVVREIRAIELDLNPTLNVTLPPDFVRMVRISWVDDQGQLHPFGVDRKLSVAETYLQDNNYNLLYDDEGNILKEDDLSDQAKLLLNSENEEGIIKRCFGSPDNFNPNVNFSNNYPNGKYNINQSGGFIQFSSDVYGKSIVLEYISDGLYEGDEGYPEDKIRVHKFAEKALNDFIYFEIIAQRNFAANEKARARKEFYNSRRIAKRRINQESFENLMQIFKGANRWNKY